MGEIITFYSYKGGVGRTMALANVAVLLAKWGYRVLLVDWDLEAPGLEYYFKKYVDLKSISTKSGLIELLYTLSSDYSKSLPETKIWQEYIINLPLNEELISLQIITAGKRDPNYFAKIRDFDLEKFYNNQDGGLVIETLRNQWKEYYDFVLIDSRTGITDIGGICTVQLPDILVLLFSATEQSLQGIVDVAQKANLARQDLPFDRFTLLSLPIPSRFDSTEEFQISSTWLNRFATVLSPIYGYWLPDQTSKRSFLELTKIPYVPYFSFDERLPVIEQGTVDPRGLGYAYENLASLIAHRLNSAEGLLHNRSEYIESAHNFYFQSDNSYSDTKKLLILQFSRVLRLCQNVTSYLNLDDLTSSWFQQINVWILRLQTQEFPVAFIGSFSSGKSTIINGIIGQDLLPESIGVTTTFPTIVRKGSRDEAEIYYFGENAKIRLRETLLEEIRSQIRAPSIAKQITFTPSESRVDFKNRIENSIKEYEKRADVSLAREAVKDLYTLLLQWDMYDDHTAKVVSLAELNAYVVGNPESLFIERLEVFVSRSPLTEGIVLIDLPGLNVANPMHRYFFESYVKDKAKAVVICMKPRQLLEGAEIQYINQLNQANPTILDHTFWVINQWDTINRVQQKEEEATFRAKMQDRNLRFIPGRFYKFSALTYLLLNSIAKGNLESAQNLRQHYDILRQYTIQDSRISSSEAESYLDTIEEVKAFEAFRSELLEYLNVTASSEFLTDARSYLRYTVTKLIGVLEPYYQEIQQDDSLENELQVIEISKESQTYFVKLQKHIDNFVATLRLWIPDLDIWGEPQREIVRSNLRKLQEIDRQELISRLQDGQDNDLGLQRLPFLIESKIILTTNLREAMAKSIHDTFVKETDKFFLQFTSVNGNFMPDAVITHLKALLTGRDVVMRIYGLADRLFFEYGQQLEEIAFSLKDIDQGSLVTRVEKSITRYQERLTIYVEQLNSEIERGIRRVLANHAGYLQEGLIKLFEPNGDNAKLINQQIARNMQMDKVIDAKRQRSSVIRQSYMYLVALLEQLKEV